GAVRRIGRGPGEFDRPTDMSLDPSRRELHIYAQNSSKIIRNDYAGRYIDELHVKYYPNDFAVHDGHYLLSMFNQLVSLRHPRYNLYITDFQLLSQKGHFVHERDREKYGDGPAFNLWPVWDGSVLYVPPHAARIYRIGRDDAISLAYDVDFGSHALPESFYREGYSEEQFFLERRARNSAYDLTSLYENERYLIGSFTSGTTLCTFIYSKTTGRVKVMAGLYARLDTPVGYKPFGLNGADEVLWLVDARAFTAAARRPDDIPDGAFKEFASRISDADNPVMVWYKIKPF
ncbi:MAG: 6-bladed beta-propeller, partial [Bacteroidales bacterium]|nr:6-bladed beta-propeller [Bacteroidales bacterium]